VMNCSDIHTDRLIENLRPKAAAQRQDRGPPRDGHRIADVLLTEYQLFRSNNIREMLRIADKHWDDEAFRD
jgi:hypothetical protein